MWLIHWSVAMATITNDNEWQIVKITQKKRTHSHTHSQRKREKRSIWMSTNQWRNFIYQAPLQENHSGPPPFLFPCIHASSPIAIIFCSSPTFFCPLFPTFPSLTSRPPMQQGGLKEMLWAPPVGSKAEPMVPITILHAGQYKAKFYNVGPKFQGG